MSATRSRIMAAAAVAAALSLGYLAQGTFAAGTPANKVAASGSSIDNLQANADLVVLSETVKINNPTDLILSATAECALTTEVTSSADGASTTAIGTIAFYVTIDGKRVPVSNNDPDNGTVVFCHRTQTQQWTNSPNSTDGDDKDKLRQYLATRDANGFNWMALNVGTNYPAPNADNIHKIELHAIWTTSNPTANSVATAIVGNRTLILDPVKAAHGETVTDLN